MKHTVYPNASKVLGQSLSEIIFDYSLFFEHLIITDSEIKFALKSTLGVAGAE